MDRVRRMAKKSEIFMEKLMFWALEGGKSPFAKDDFSKRPGLSQAGGVSLEPKSRKKGKEKRY